MTKTLHYGRLTYYCSNTIGFIRICFTNWDLWSFSQGDLLQDCSEQRSYMDFHMSLVHCLSLSLKHKTHKLNSVPFLGHLNKYHLNLCSSRYRNFPQVSYLGMNSGRGWNPKLEGSYLPEYRESEAEFWTQCT